MCSLLEFLFVFVPSRPHLIMYFLKLYKIIFINILRLSGLTRKSVTVKASKHWISFQKVFRFDTQLHRTQGRFLALECLEETELNTEFHREYRYCNNRTEPTPAFVQQSSCNIVGSLRQSHRFITRFIAHLSQFSLWYESYYT